MQLYLSLVQSIEQTKPRIMHKFLFLLCFLVAISAHAQFPYNPDEDNDQLITVNDLNVFLSSFGLPFESDGVLPILNGGTGASTVSAARDSLNLSMFLDSVLTVDGDDLPVGWVTGRLRVTNSIIEGFETVASGDYAHAEGYETEATGNFSHSQNRFTLASGVCASASGEGSVATGTASHAEGFQCSATNTAAHAEGFQTQALGLYSHAENRFTTADGICAHAEGEGSSALADAAHSEGFQTEALAFAAHAEGYQSEASGAYSHARNRGTIASGTNASASGLNSSATGQQSSAAGEGTVADQDNQFAVGSFNNEGQMDVLFVVGNGTGDTMRSDAFVVNSNGDATIIGDLEIGEGLTVNGEDLMMLIMQLQASNEALQNQVDQLQQQIDDLSEGQ